MYTNTIVVLILDSIIHHWTTSMSHSLVKHKYIIHGNATLLTNPECQLTVNHLHTCVYK